MRMESGVGLLRELCGYREVCVPSCAWSAVAAWCVCVQVGACVQTEWGRAGVCAQSFVAAGMCVGV